ncbi:MAG: nicotinate (nicotinamide) nucleotide adenylyltransferase [Nitrospirota bacterium]
MSTRRAPPRIGVFGGTFNPIHVCHLRIAARVRELAGLDRVIFVPAAIPPHKAGDLAPAAHRFEMVKLAVAGWPRFGVDDLELTREGPSYSADTMEVFRRRYPDADLSFLLGIEMFRTLSAWRDPHRLVAACRLLVIGRQGTPFAGLVGLPWMAETPREALERLDAQAGEAVLDLSPHAPVCLIRPIPCDASSTQIRRDLAAGRSVKKVLPAPVQSYILQNRLYGVRETNELSNRVAGSPHDSDG